MLAHGVDHLYNCSSSRAAVVYWLSLAKGCKTMQETLLVSKPCLLAEVPSYSAASMEENMDKYYK